MSTRNLATEFAPAERVPIEVVQRQRAAIAESPSTRQLLDAVLNHVFILNAQRQIVFASQNVQALLGRQGLDSIIGQRPGEALDCLHARDMEAGCGTSVSCKECGAAKAILAGLGGQKTTMEARLTRIINLTPTALELLVHAVPFEHKGENYVIFSAVPISGEKGGRAPAAPGS
jgi:hypothetical protein